MNLSIIPSINKPNEDIDILIKQFISSPIDKLNK